jgi:hypothetical protein
MVLPFDGNYHLTIIILSLNTHSVKKKKTFNIHITTFGFPKHKVTNMDGIPMDIFQELWLEIGKNI